jgi:MFS family permease
MVLLSPATIIGEISKTIGTDLGEASALTMFAGTVFIIISAFFSGKLIDRVGVYIIMVSGSLLFTAGTILVHFIGDSYTGLFVVRLLQGCGVGPVMAGLPLVVTQWSERNERGIIFGIQGVILSVGAATAMYYVPFVFRRTGSWQAAMFWVVIFCFLALLLSLIIYFGPKPYVKPSGPQSDKVEDTYRDIKDVYLWPVTWAVLSCSFWFAWVIRIFYDLIPSFLTSDKPIGAGIGLAQAGFLMSSMHIITIAGSLSSGIILETVFKGRPKKLIMITFIVSALSWYLMKLQYLSSNILILSVLILLSGFALSFTVPMLMTFVTKNYPEQVMGKVGGVITMFTHFGTLIGLASASYSLHARGTYSMTLALISAAGLLGFFSAFFLIEPEAVIEEK